MLAPPTLIAAPCDNFRTGEQQLYKNPFSGGGGSVAWHVYFTFSSCKFYIFGLSRHIFRNAKLQASNLV